MIKSHASRWNKCPCTTDPKECYCLFCCVDTMRRLTFFKTFFLYFTYVYMYIQEGDAICPLVQKPPEFRREHLIPWARVTAGYELNDRSGNWTWVLNKGNIYSLPVNCFCSTKKTDVWPRKKTLTRQRATTVLDNSASKPVVSCLWCLLNETFIITIQMHGFNGTQLTLVKSQVTFVLFLLLIIIIIIISLGAHHQAPE